MEPLKNKLTPERTVVQTCYIIILEEAVKSLKDLNSTSGNLLIFVFCSLDLI